MRLPYIFSGVSGKVEINGGVDRINQSLAMIFETFVGEVAMLPIVGSDLASMLFEPSDDFLKDKVQITIMDALDRLEPRIRVDSVVVTTEDNYVFVKVNYHLTGTNMAGIFDYSITKSGKGDAL